MFSIVKMFSKLKRAGGTTADHLALQKINDKLTPDKVKKIKDGKLVVTVMLLTDGGSDNPGATRLLVKELLNKGVVIRAIQIGIPSPGRDGQPGDAEKYSYVWNSFQISELNELARKQIIHSGPINFGVVLGTDMEKVFDETEKVLSGVLGDITL
jgi:hypothetical protein